MHKKLIGKEIATLSGEYRYWPDEKPGKPLTKTTKEREIDFGKAGYHDVKAVRLANKAQCRRVAPKYIKDFNYPWLRYLDLFPGDYWECENGKGIRSPNKRAPPNMDWTTSLARAQYGEAIRLQLLKQEDELQRTNTSRSSKKEVQFVEGPKTFYRNYNTYEPPPTLERDNSQIKIVHNNSPLPPEKSDPVKNVVTIDRQNFGFQGDRANTIKVFAHHQPDQVRIITNQVNYNSWQPPVNSHISTVPVEPIYARVNHSRRVNIEPPQQIYVEPPPSQPPQQTYVEPPPPQPPQQTYVEPPPPQPPQNNFTQHFVREVMATEVTEDIENPLYETATETITLPPPKPEPAREPEIVPEPEEDYFTVTVVGGNYIDEVIVPEEAVLYYGRKRSNSLPGETPWMTGKTFEETEELQHQTLEGNRNSVRFEVE